MQSSKIRGFLGGSTSVKFAAGWAALALAPALSTACAQADDSPYAEGLAQGETTGQVSAACRRHPPQAPAVLNRQTRLYVPPNGPAAAQAEIYRQSGLEEEAALMQAVAEQPQVVYLVGGSPEEVHSYVRETVRNARRQHQIPVFAAYNVPGRDCSQYSAGGATDEEEFRAWIDAIAEALGQQRAVVLVEPDGVALLPTEPWCAEGGGGLGTEPEDLERVSERFRELRYAVQRFEGLEHVDVYLDAGHSAWHPINDYDAYYGEPQLQFGIVSRLMLAGIRGARGFYLNPSNGRSTAELTTYGERIAKCLALLNRDPDTEFPEIYEPNVTYDEEGRFSSPCPSPEVLDAMPLTPQLARFMPHFVLDTSRNGQGPWNLGDPETTNDDAAAFQALYGYETTDPEIWCNAPGGGIGLRPTTRTGHPLIDAYLWIKVPGESDGQCGRNLTSPEPTWPAGYDLAWGQVDPPAGQWFEAQALELARLAEPPLLP